jgi:hypothetical protein
VSTSGATRETSRFWLDVVTLAELRMVAEALEHAHTSLAHFDNASADEGEWRFASPWRFRPAWPSVAQYSTRELRTTWHEQAAISMLPSDQLHIVRLELASPGWLEVVGAWNPLESIRKALKDREERRRNRQFRDRIEEDRGDLENERLRLENERLRNEVIRDRGELLEDLGVPCVERAQLLNIAVIEPLDRVGDLADQGLLGLERPGTDPSEGTAE